MSALGGFFDSDSGEDTSNEIHPDDAARTAQTFANVRLASETARQGAMTDIAKRKPVTKTVTDHGDGTQSVTVHNAPQQDPATEVRDAAMAPHYEWMKSIVQSLDTGAQEAYGKTMPGTPEFEQAMQTPEGRRKLLQDTGFKDEWESQHHETGWLGAIVGHHKYGEIADNPNLVRRILYQRQARELTSAAQQSQGVVKDVEYEQQQQRQQQRLDIAEQVAQRRDLTEERQQEETFLKDFQSGHYEGLDEKTADGLIDAEKQRYGARFRDETGKPKEMPPYMETVMRAHIANDKAIAAAKKAAEETKDEHWQKTYDRLLASQNERNKVRTTYGDAQNLPVDELISRANDDTYHQPDVQAAIPIRQAAIDKQRQKLIADRSLLSARNVQISRNANDRQQRGAAPSDAELVEQQGNAQKMKTMTSQLQQLDADSAKLKNWRSGGGQPAAETPAPAPAKPAASGGAPKLGDPRPMKDGRMGVVARIRGNSVMVVTPEKWKEMQKGAR